MKSSMSKDKGALTLSSKHVVETRTLVNLQSEPNPWDKERQQFGHRQVTPVGVSTSPTMWAPLQLQAELQVLPGSPVCPQSL